MYQRDQLSFYLAINPSQAYFCSLVSPSQQVLSYMRTSSLVTMQIDRVLYYVQIQPDNVLHRLALTMLKFKGFMEKMAIKQESAMFRQKRFRVYFSFKNQDIQNDQFRDMLEFFKFIGFVLMQHDKRKQLLVSFNAKQQAYSQFLQSLNKEVEMVKIIKRNQLIQSLINNKEACRLSGLYIDKIDQSAYLVFTDRSKLRMKITKKGELFKIARLLNFAVQENYKIQIVIEIGDTVDFYLDIAINTWCKISQINKIKEIIKIIVSQKIHLLYPTVQITSKNIEQNLKTFYIEAKTLEDIYQFMKFSYYENTDTSPLTRQCYLRQKESTRFNNIKNRKEKYQHFSMEEITWLTEEYSRRNLLFLKPYWDSGLVDFLDDFYVRWEDYRLHWVDMCKFIRLLDYKSYQIQEKYAIIYPKSLEIIEKFMKKVGQKTIAHRINQKTLKSKQDKDTIQSKVLNQMMHYLKIQDHVIDQIIRYLIRVQHPDNKDEKFRLSISNQLLKGKPVNFSNLIAVIEEFQDETSKWQDVLHLVFKQIYKITVVSKTIPNPCVKEPIVQNTYEKNKKYMNQEAYLDKIQNEKLIKVNCLGCSQHFLYNMNIKDNSVNTKNLVVFQKADHVKLSPLQVKLSICGLLNSIEGGIILFGCQKKYLDIHTQGSVISQSMKQEFIQLITTFRHSFYPRLQEKNVIVNFVPIIANPYLINPFEDRWLAYEGNMKQLKSTKYVRRKYYEGTYVMRIIVRPIKQGMIHYFEHDQNQTKIGSKYIKENSLKNYKLAIFEDFRIVEIPISQLRKTMKKFFANHIDSELSIQTAYLLKIPSLSYHTCQQPEQGLPVVVKYDDVPEDTTNNWWQKYKFITQVVSKRKYLLVMRDNLREIGYDCQIQRKFLQYDLQSAKNTAIIYHDVDFSQLKYVIKNNHSFTRIAGEIQVFPIKSCVKVWRNGGKAISLDDQRKFKKWFNTEFPSSILKTSESTVEKERNVTYFKGTNKIEAFFIYLILKNFNENAVMEDESAKINWKVPCKQSDILFIQADQFKSKLCLQAQKIYDLLFEITKNYNVNINKPTEQKWVRKLCSSLINEDALNTWQRMLERGQRKDLVVKFIRKIAGSKQCVIYLGEKITRLWKMVQYEDKGDSNLQVIHSFSSLQQENQYPQNGNIYITPLQIAEEASSISEMESNIQETIVDLIEQTSRRHSKVLQRIFQQQIPEFCINQIAEQKIAKQFSKIVFNVKTTQQIITIRNELESIVPSIDFEIDIDHLKTQYGYSKLFLQRLLTWTTRFQQIEDCEIIKLFKKFLFENKALSDRLLDRLQSHAESFSFQKDIVGLKSIDFLLSSKLFAFCGDKLDNTQTTVKRHMDKLQFMQASYVKQQIPQQKNIFTFDILQYTTQQLKKMRQSLMIKERIHNQIEQLQNKEYGRMMANAHYISQLLSYLKGKDLERQQQLDQIIKLLVEFIEFITKEITKISFKTIKQSFWLFNLLKNSWLFQEFKQISSNLTNKIDNFEKEIFRNLLRMIDELLLEKRQKINLQKFVYILEKARQLLPLQKFTQFSSYKKEQVLKILQFKLNWQAFQKFGMNNQQINRQAFTILIDVLQSIEFQLYIREFLIIDVEQIKKKYKYAAPQSINKWKHLDYKKGSAQLRKIYYHQEQQIKVVIKKGDYGQDEIVVYSNIKRTDKKDYKTFVRLQREAIEQFLFQHELESLSNKLPKNNHDQQDNFSSSSRQGMLQLTTKWLLQKLMKNNSNIIQKSTECSQITSSEEIIQMSVACSLSQVKIQQPLQIQIKQCQQEIISHLFNLYVDQYHKVKINIEYNKIIGKKIFLEFYQIFKSLKRYKPFITIINEECFAQKAMKEINQIKDRNNYFPQEDFIGLDPVQTYKDILAFMEENRQLNNRLNKFITTVDTSAERFDQNFASKLQELYESIAAKQHKNENNNEAINQLFQLRLILQKMQRNKLKEPITNKLISTSYKIQKIFIKYLNNFFLNIEDVNQIQNQLLNYINKVEIVRRIEVLEGRSLNIDINKATAQFKNIHEKAKDELQKIFEIGSENKYFNAIIILIDLVKKSKTAVGVLKERCDQFEKDLSLKILQVINKQIQSNDKKMTDLKQKMKDIKGAQAYDLNDIESDIKDLEVSIMKIVKLNKMQPDKCLVDFKETNYFEVISQWKVLLQENSQAKSDCSRFNKNIQQIPRTFFELSQLAFHKTIKTYHQQFIEAQKYQQDSFYSKLLKANPQNLASLQQKMQLLGKIIAIFDITHQQLRTVRVNFNNRMTVQSAKISQQLRQNFCEIVLNIQKKQDTSKLFVINGSLQDRVIAMGIISIYLAKTTQKEVNIACSPFFAYKSQQLFQQVLKNCNLQNRVKVFTYKQALTDALAPIIKVTYQELSKLFNQKDIDMEKIMIQRKGDQQILFPKINKKILMIDEASTFFDFLRKQNVFVQTMTLSDPKIQAFLKMIKKTVSQNQEKFLTKVLMQNTTKTFFKQHPFFDKILIQQTKKMIRDVKDYKSSYQIIQGKLIHQDCNGRLNEELNYGYKTIFNILEEFQAERIASVHKKSAVKMEIMLNVFDLLALDVYFGKFYGFVEYENSLCTPTAEFFMPLYKIQKERNIQISKDQDFRQKGRNLLIETIKREQNSLQKIIKFVQQAPQFHRVIILKDNKQIQELTRLQQFAILSKQSWILKSTKDIEWPFYQQNQLSSKNIIITTQECFTFILKDMVIYQLQRQQAKNIIIFCSYKPQELHPYIHLEQYVDKIVFVQTEDIFDRQEYQDLQELKCLESLKSRQRQTFHQKSISRYRFVNNILALNMIQSRLLPNHNIIICINANSQSLRLFDFRLLIHTIYQQANTRQFNLFIKVIVFRRAKDGKGKCRYVETPFNDDPNPLLCFLKDFEPEGNFDPADTHDMLNIIQAYQASRYFVFLEKIQKIVDVNLQKVKLLQMPYKKHDLSLGQTLYDLYNENQLQITKKILREIQIMGVSDLSNPPSQ